ncbi:hypothetical protein Syun_018396 [Stephania yunnanensis]|uniref:Uncharacterized protein n=1 Tax=Stephania yunnanensis TaxID=152371 RepID=A0AAP0IS79_9MAGN
MTTTNKLTTICISSSSDDDDDTIRPSRKAFFTVVKTEETTTDGTYICGDDDNDDDDDCVVLDFDPFESVDLSKKLSINDCEQDLAVVAEKRQVIACRDYPHSRHLCAKYPFNKTPHQTHCDQCYCYVCDLAAPCEFWSGVLGEHCNASAVDPKWKTVRQTWKVVVGYGGGCEGLGKEEYFICEVECYYCYVCDLAAPCKFWSGDLGEHCNASDVDPKWNTVRQILKVVAAKWFKERKGSSR